MLYAEIFLAMCFSTLEKDICCKLEKSCYTCSLELQTPMLSKQSELYFVQPLQAQQSCETSCKEVLKRACDTLQPQNSIATQIATKIEPYKTSCRVWFYFSQRLHTFFFKAFKLQPKIAICNMFPATCNGSLSNVARQVSSKIAACNVSVNSKLALPFPRATPWANVSVKSKKSGFPGTFTCSKFYTFSLIFNIYKFVGKT